ncbi:MAG: hypothetical protein GXO32_08120 [Crenarchaeota archaeon]|nr:hypothetical protein [Thermoproteota archaeon]
MDPQNLEEFSGYVLYGRDAKDLLERVVRFARGCEKLVFDTRLSELAREVCKDAVELVEFSSRRDVEDCLSKGKYAVILLRPPIDGIESIALIVGRATEKSKRRH